jgi:hypothetical protein
LEEILVVVWAILATPEVINESNAHGYRLSSNQNRSGIEFGLCVTENSEYIGISKVDCSQYRMDTSKTAQPGVSDCVGDCGISDLPPVDCARMMAIAVVHQGIFEDRFSEEWTEGRPEFKSSSAIIDHIIQICDFPADSIMVNYIGQQQ